jgi:hypothetical protein
MVKLEEKPKKKSMDEKISELGAKRTKLELGGGKERIDKQQASGKLTARERVTKLVDRGGFKEIGLFARHRATFFGMAEKELPADGVVTIKQTVTILLLLKSLGHRHKTPCTIFSLFIPLDSEGSYMLRPHRQGHLRTLGLRFGTLRFNQCKWMAQTQPPGSNPSLDARHN